MSPFILSLLLKIFVSFKPVEIFIFFLLIVSGLLHPHSCSVPLAADSVCRPYLPYDTTSSSEHIQSLFNRSTEMILNQLASKECYNLSRTFVCGMRFPGCQPIGFPLLPCQSMCEGQRAFISTTITSGSTAHLFLYRY